MNKSLLNIAEWNSWDFGHRRLSRTIGPALKLDALLTMSNLSLGKQEFRWQFKAASPAISLRSIINQRLTVWTFQVHV